MVKSMPGRHLPSRPRQKGAGLARGAASLALAGTLSACTLLGGNGANGGISGTVYAPASLDGVPDNLASRANSVLQTYDTPPASILEARRRADRAAETVEEFLSSEGYLAVSAMPQRIETAASTPTIDVTPGARFRIASVTVAYEGDIDPGTNAEIDRAKKGLLVGGPAHTSSIERMDAVLVNHLKEAGYAFATSADIDVLASRAETSVEITYTLIPGPRVKLGELILPDDATTRPPAIRVMQSWKMGDYYTPEKIRTLRTRLRSSGLYDGIGIEIAETPDADGTHSVELLLAESKPRSVGVGASLSTTEGAGIDAFWEKRNITGRGDTVRVEGAVANISRNLTASYELPNIGRYGRTLDAEIGARQQETDAYDLTGLKTGATLSQPFNKNFTISAGAYVDVTRTVEYELTRSGPSDPIDQVTFSTPLSATYNTVKNALDPQDGNRLLLTLEPSVSTGTVNAVYTRYLTNATTYHSFTDKLIAAARVEAGGFMGDTDVPADRLFFAGGGGTVRGYAYQSLSPTNLDGDYLGGEALFDASFELRWRKSKRWGYAAFVDTGAAAADFGEVFGDLRSAFGLGVRYYPGFGPIRLDIATPISPREGDDPVQIYISIGQAF
ncbi:autotransporter assembly complex family protein [uncultured Hyphomonas sp.]|uniref:autotransporter assembly complex protein TamA n=1 Tax=uncultured Hyphomonas sp. TaxID=225298 RepID=UPI002AAAA85F|nr:autotransporter assembly complex family protein [uncultured Hyphomonas sp.]